MKSNVLALCDTEEEYARHMTEYLKGHKEAPWDIRTYTDVKSLRASAEQTPIEILVVAESAYTDEVRSMPVEKTVLLNESGVVRWENIRNVNKYQQAENVYKEILSEYMEVLNEPLPRLVPECTTRMIGFFTPVRRNLQTTFALTMGQMLSVKYRTLYLNFEYCAGYSQLLPDTRTRDLADLVYFLNTDKERFLLRMQTMLLKKGQMDYIPPVKAGMTLLEVRAEEWKEMITRIQQSGEYDFIILDLSECVQGLPEILRMCSKVFTLTGDDRYARGKLAQYEQIMAFQEYEDVLGRTSRYKLPRFRNIPEDIELLPKGELGDYVRRIMGEVTSS